MKSQAGSGRPGFGRARRDLAGSGALWSGRVWVFFGLGRGLIRYGRFWHGQDGSALAGFGKAWAFGRDD